RRAESVGDVACEARVELVRSSATRTHMSARSLRIEPLPGYTPTIGRLVGMLTYARHTTLAAVEGLSMVELDHLHDDSSNSIGALLARLAVVERGYQCMTFED